MSRIEQVMRELSDLRDFYLKIQNRHPEENSGRSTSLVAERPAEYDQNGDVELKNQGKEL
jgi:hypothetical protein